MANNVSTISDCANCGACVCTCPVNAISIKEDLFYKIDVDSEKCIDCGKCLNACPVNSNKQGNKPMKAVGGWASNAEIRSKSSSGGIFTLLAEETISSGGVVFGACFSENRKQVIFNSTDCVPLDELRRSKYVESRTGDSFVAVRKNLEKGRQVLYCGTSCQVAGLSNFLGKNYNNLILCDLACGGLSAHKLYENYIDNLEKKYDSKVTYVNFRPKALGWARHHILIKFENGKQYKRLAYLDPYFYGFLFARVSIRENCYRCKFSNNHFSDITLADYWKYADTPEIINDGKGISLITVNTEKGLSALERIADKMQYYELDLNKATYNFKETKYNDSVTDKRKKFFSVFMSDGLNKAARVIGMPYGLNAVLIMLKQKL